jgi:carboxylate-amine ligase
MNHEPVWGLFEVYGIEVEYMIVDRETLAVRPIADEVLKGLAGDYVQDIDRGDYAWSNEFVCHLLELKTNGPASSLAGPATGFPEEIHFVNKQLAPHGAMLLGTGAHPIMVPEQETRIWPHGDRKIYRAYDRIFGCRDHGWSNLQSVHLNLPFDGDEEFGRLHAAIRLVLPIIPALSASTPILDGRVTGYLDTRLETYRHNQDRIPSIAGRIIPEPAFTRDDYQCRIFDPIERDIRPHDPDGVLEVVFLNSRGAIARFDRNAIEIRVIDSQEATAADLAVLDLVIAVLKLLVEEAGIPLAEQQAWPEDLLADIFLAVIRDGEEAVIADRDFLHAFGIGSRRLPAGGLWQSLANRVVDRLGPEHRHAQARILSEGPLARRLLRRLGSHPTRDHIETAYRELGACLAGNRLWP